MSYLLTNRAAGPFADRVAASMSADGFDSLGFLESVLSAGPHSRICYVVPTGRRVRWLLREITRRVAQKTGRPLIGFQVYNLARLGAALYGQLFPDDTTLPLSDGMRLALFEQAISNLARDGKLPFYAPTGRPSWSIIERLAEVISGLREDGILPADLRRDLENESEPFAIDRARLADVLAIYEQYLALLQGRFRDDTTVYERVGDAFLTGQYHVDFPPILIEGFSEFRVPELRMLGALATSTIAVCIVLAYSEVNGPLFGNLQRTLDTLTALGFTTRRFDPDPEQQPRWLRPRAAYLRRWLFNTEKEIRNPEFNACITTIGCTNRLEEVTLIAKYTKHCLVKLGYKPHQICVAMRDPERYADLFRELFSVHGIPANISDRFRLDRSPVAVALMSILAIITHGWRREDVHRALANPLVRFVKEDGSVIDATTINNVAERQRITGGHTHGGLNGWLARLRRALDHANHYLHTLRDDPYADPLDIRHAEQDYEQIHRALDDIEHLARVLPSDQQMMTPQEFCAFIRDSVLVGAGILGSIEESFERSWSLVKDSPESITHAELLEQETRAYAAIIEVLTEIEHSWSAEEPTKRKLADFAELLSVMIRATRYQIAEKPSYGVTVTSIEQTRGIPYDVYILCGMVDGEFPRAYSTEYFLGKELPESEERHIRAERIQFYDALTNNPSALERNTWRMLITYPRMTSTGEQLVRSSFIDKLFKITMLQERCYESHRLLAEYQHNPSEYAEFEWLVAITSPEEAQRSRSSTCISPWRPVADVRLDADALRSIQPLLEHPFSATDFEQYAHCPYQYFAEHILRLRPPQEQELALSQRDVGSVLHRILYRFYGTLLDQEVTSQGGVPSVRLDPNERERYRQLLVEIASGELERLRHSHPLFALESELLLGTETDAGLLDQWLDRELERFAEGWEYAPALFELAFGMRASQKEQPHDAIQLSPTLTLRGKIDRIELARRGSVWHAIIADYKRSQPGASNAAIEKGTAFQMPLYMLAASRLLRERLGSDPILDGGIYYILQPKGDDAYPIAMPQEANRYAQSRKSSRSRVLKNYPEQQELLKRALEHAERIVSDIRRGIFPVAPRSPSVCEQCSFGSVCRIRQLRDDGIIGIHAQGEATE